MRQGDKNVRCMRRSAWGLQRKLTLGAIMLALLIPVRTAPQSLSATDSLTAYEMVSEAPDTMVHFTPAQAGSLLTLIDIQRVDIWECRNLAALDSAWAVEKAQIVQNRYDALLNAQPNWFERAVKHPMLWFVLGTYLGVQAGALES